MFTAYLLSSQIFYCLAEYNICRSTHTPAYFWITSLEKKAKEFLTQTRHVLTLSKSKEVQECGNWKHFQLGDVVGMLLGGGRMQQPTFNKKGRRLMLGKRATGQRRQERLRGNDRRRRWRTTSAGFWWLLLLTVAGAISNVDGGNSSRCWRRQQVVRATQARADEGTMERARPARGWGWGWGYEALSTAAAVRRKGWMLTIHNTKNCVRISFVSPRQWDVGQKSQHLAVGATCCQHVTNIPSQGSKASVQMAQHGPSNQLIEATSCVERLNTTI